MQNSLISSWQDVLPYLVAQIERIPAASWVGILTFLGALLVVWRTNAQHIKRLKLQLAAEDLRSQRQLEHDAQSLQTNLKHDGERLMKHLAHDAEQRANERLVSMRREVYADASGEFEKYRKTLMSLPDADGALDAHHAVTAALARISLVCTSVTRPLTTEVAIAYGTAGSAALVLMQPIITKRIEENAAKEKYRFLVEQRAALFTQRIALTDLPNAEFATTAAQTKLSTIEAMVKILSEKITDGHDSHISLSKERGSMSVQAMGGIAELLNPAIKSSEALLRALRVELGIDQPTGANPSLASDGNHEAVRIRDQDSN